MMHEERPIAWHWQRMPAATLGAGAGITPVQNTWYTVLDAKNVRIKSIITRHVNDETAIKVVGVRLTCDGIVISGAQSQTNNLPYVNYLTQTSDTLTGVNVTSFNLGYYISLGGKSVKVEARTTSAVGTNPLLFCTVQYEQIKRVIK